MSITLAVTHFNNTTLLENERWREINNYGGCIYNSPVAIKETIMLLINARIHISTFIISNRSRK